MAVRALIALWTACIVAQAVLNFFLYRNAIYKRCPVFTAFLSYDLARWVGMYGVWLWGTRTQYGFWFLASEPGSMILLCAAGIEAFGQLVHEKPPLAAYVAIILAVLSVGCVLPHVREVPMTWMFTQRALMAFVPLSLLVVASAWHEQLPDGHGIIITVFCLFDLVTYLSLALYPEWAKTHPLDAPLFVMSGQCCCLVAWAVRFSRISR